MMGTNEELPVLCSYWQSSCSWRVRIGLAWKGIAYTTMRVLTDDGEFTDEYVQLNPSKRLPALIIDGHVLTQSASILEYLEETRPEKPLLPAEPLARSRVRTICQLIAADIQPMQNLGMIEKVVEDLPKEEQAAKTSAWGKHWIHRGFLGLEQELARTAGKFCVGDSVTMADLFLVPQVYNANRFGVDMSEFPTIARISAELSLIPAFQYKETLRLDLAHGAHGCTTCPPRKPAQEKTIPKWTYDVVYSPFWLQNHSALHQVTKALESVADPILLRRVMDYTSIY